MSIQTQITRISNAKTDIVSAIQSHGVSVPSGTKLDALAPYIRSISSNTGGFTSNDFTYSGTYQLLDDGNGNWRLRFLTGGTFRPKKAISVDAFLVGGGGSGGNGIAYCGGGGGGGGYTKTVSKVSLAANTDYTITIAGTGGTTSAFNNSAGGGANGKDGVSYESGAEDHGGDGGCGGGAGKYNALKDSPETHYAGDGGTNGSDGGNSFGGTTRKHYGGQGQGTPTLEFGEGIGDAYSAGGGGGAGSTSSGNAWTLAGKGGAGINGGGGAGGAGKYLLPPSTSERLGSNGGSPAANTGHGGGGGSAKSRDGSDIVYVGGTGASGVVVIRNAR